MILTATLAHDLQVEVTVEGDARIHALVAKHTHGANFGRKVAGCGRCEQLAAGAAPIQQAWRKPRRFDGAGDVSAHFRSDKHRSGGCGPVCTAYDW